MYSFLCLDFFFSFYESYGIIDCLVKNLLLSWYSDDLMDCATIFNPLGFSPIHSVSSLPWLRRMSSRPQRSKSWEEPVVRTDCDTACVD